MSDEKHHSRAPLGSAESSWAWCRAALLAIAIWMIILIPDRGDAWDLPTVFLNLFIATMLLRLREL